MSDSISQKQGICGIPATEVEDQEMDGEETGKGRKSAGESELLPTGGGEVSVQFPLT